MKKKLLLLFMLIAFVSLHAQEKNSDRTIESFTYLRDKAATSENYELAALYQRAIDLKTNIKKSAKEGKYDLAAKYKKELDAMSFDPNKTKTNSASDQDDSKDRYQQKSELINSGLFLDFLLGPGFAPNYSFASSNIGINIGFRLGNKFYFGSSERYRPGMQLTWFRLGIQPNIGLSSVIVELYPVNVGYGSILNFNGKMGLEINFDIGLGIAFDVENENLLLGFHANPNVKFRYKVFAVGIDASFLNGSDLLSTSFVGLNSINKVSLSVGFKF